MRLVMVALLGVSIAMLVQQLLDPTPLRLAGLTIDRLGAALTLLVSSVGAVTFRYSERYLDGEPAQVSFLRSLAGTVASAYLLMLSTNLFLLFAAWSLTSLGLHRLLTHYGDRPESAAPARKKFLISRLGDLALLAAIVMIWSEWRTVDLDSALAAATSGPATATVSVIALLVVTAALAKSAQFPFHSWLPETMEAPTPVSALMHAGIINAGGALLLRFAPLLLEAPVALLLLSAIGTLTLVVGTLAMWTQANVKRSLAWSTVGQMGFMMVQCGLAAFPAALLHIVGHGYYKAWKFLRAGELPETVAEAGPPSGGRRVAVFATGVAASVPALALASWISGFDPRHSPGELALAAIVAIASGHLWAAPGARTRGVPLAAASLGGTLLLALAAFGLYRAASSYLEPIVGPHRGPEGVIAWIAALPPVAAILFLSVVHMALPAITRRSWGRALVVHAHHGFYCGAIADRIVEWIWSRSMPAIKEVARA